MTLDSNHIVGLASACTRQPGRSDVTTFGYNGAEVWIVLTPNRIVSVRLRGTQAANFHAWAAACRPRAANTALLTANQSDTEALIEFYPAARPKPAPAEDDVTDPIPAELLKHLDRAGNLARAGKRDQVVHDQPGLRIVIANGSVRVFLVGYERRRYELWLNQCRLRARLGALSQKTRTPASGQPNLEYIPMRK